jgi:WD repeat-containing protein 35
MQQEQTDKGTQQENAQVSLNQTAQHSIHLDDKLLADVHRQMGQVYMDRRRWKKATRYFVLSKQTDKLAECLFQLGDMATLKDLQGHLPENSPVHKQLASKYESIGMCKQAVDCYVKVRPLTGLVSVCHLQLLLSSLLWWRWLRTPDRDGMQAGMVQRAIECCSKLNHWALAIDLAREHGMQVDNLLESKAAHLRQHGRKVDEVNLYKKAESHHRSAQVLVELAKHAMVCFKPKLDVK